MHTTLQTYTLRYDHPPDLRTKYPNIGVGGFAARGAAGRHERSGALCLHPWTPHTPDPVCCARLFPCTAFNARTAIPPLDCATVYRHKRYAKSTKFLSTDYADYLT